MKNIITFLSKYKHAWLLCYGFIYLPWFCYLEKTVTRHYHVMHVALDDFIPFNEYFIIPYMMWFLYVAGTIVFFLFRNKEDYYRICTFLFSGMTISLIICTFFHNGTDFRPAIDPGKNIFSGMVAALYQTDTPTNVFPSIHVYNSIGTHIELTDKLTGIEIYLLVALLEFIDRKSTRLNSSHSQQSRMPSSA